MATATSLNGQALNAYDVVPAGTTDSVLVAAKPGFKLRVYSYMINQGDTTPSAVTFTSKGVSAGTAVWVPLKYPANGGTNSPDNSQGWFETNAGEGLSVSTGAGSPTGVGVTYRPIIAR